MATALLSVYDKTGIVELAAGLHAAGWRIVSSGGTAKAVAEAGVPVTDLADLTGLPGDPRPSGGHAAPEGARRPARRPHQPRPPDRHGRARHRGHRPRGGRTSIPFDGDPSIELIDIGGPGHGARRGQEPRARRRGGRTRPTTARSSTSCGRRALSRPTRRRLARDAFATIAAYDAAIANWFDEDPLRRRRHCPPAPAPRRSSARRRCATARTLTSRARATASPARTQLVGRRRAARRQGAQLPQPVRHRGGMEAGAPLRRAGLRHRQARQPVRRRRRRRPSRGLRAGQRVRPGHGLRRHRRRQPTGHRGDWPRRWRRCSPRWWWPRRSRPARSRCSPRSRTSACSRPPPPVGAALDMRTIDGGLLVQQADTVTSTGRVAGGHEAQPTDAAVGRPRASPGRCAPR